ncbi:MAG: rod shape-determining protein [Dactylosporangium sp.]|nr:rod shape-determining protein [Dactylosporangium sp.]
MPRQVAVSSGDLRGALAAAAEPLLSAIRDVLTQVSPEAAADIADTGLVLTGGASRLHGLDGHLSDAFELPVVRAEDPCAAVARGLHRILGRSEAPRRGHGRFANPRPVGLRRNFHG